jgi:hypothetical protein
MRREEGTQPEPLTAELVEAHRLRSVHAHCWNEDEFLDLLLYACRDLGLGFAIVDGLSARTGRGGWEFGFVLQKVLPTGHDPSEDLLASWNAVVARQASVDRWPVGVVVALVVDALGELSPPEVGATSEVIDVVLHRPDLRAAFAAQSFDIGAALRWAAHVASGETADTDAARLVPHASVLARWA